MIYLDFIIEKEHLFLRNIFEPDILKKCDQINQIKKCYDNFKKMLNCCVLLDKCYSMESDIEDIDHDCLENFLRVDLNDEYENFKDIYEEINK